MPNSPLVASLFARRIFSPLLGFLMVLTMAGASWKILLSMRRGAPEGSDYLDSYVVGGLVRQGRAACAYSAECLRGAMEAQIGRSIDLPWAYPPHYSALVSALAGLPYHLSYLAFDLGTFALFFAVVRRLAPQFSAFAFALVIPAMLINLINAQNGFLTAGLIGLFALLYLRGDARCGIALGAMIIKPHLAITLGVLLLAKGRWAAIGWAALVVAGTSLAITLAMGPSIWTAFLGATQASADRLWEGRFPMQRMTSVYASAFQFGLGPQISFALQAVVAVAVLGGIWLLARRGGDARLVLGGAVAGAVLVSPYNYDYDLPILAVALALVSPLVLQGIKGREAVLLVLLAWGASANHQLSLLLVRVLHVLKRGNHAWSLSSVLIIAAAVLCWIAIRRVASGRSAGPPEAALA